MFVEQTHLPRLVVSGKSNEPQVEVYVNAYVVGRRKELLTNGKLATPLYYLSVVAPRGAGTSVQAVFARFVNIYSKGADLEGVGEVFLAHHRSRIASCGYPLHWNFEQAEVLPERDLHAVIESQMLSIADPVRAMAVKPRKERLSATPGKTRSKGRTSLSTAKAGKALASIGEVRARENNPLFLLLVPTWLTLEERARHLLHFAFLDPRVPWPLDPSWASFLWERGIREGEIEPLQVWSYVPASPLEDFPDETCARVSPETTIVPFLAEAYFCRPNLARLYHDLAAALHNKHLLTPGVFLQKSLAQEESDQMPLDRSQAEQVLVHA